MRRHTLIAAVAVAGALVVSGAALAGTTPPPEPTQACQRAQERLDDLEARAAELTTDIDQLEAQLASGDLTAKQEKKARQRLANLQERLGNVQERIDKAEARVATRCGEPTEEPTDPPTDPGPTE
jgi:peptidoglycan hydrolase CwlO-like protein